MKYLIWIDVIVSVWLSPYSEWRKSLRPITWSSSSCSPYRRYNDVFLFQYCIFIIQLNSLFWELFYFLLITAGNLISCYFLVVIFHMLYCELHWVITFFVFIVTLYFNLDVFTCNYLPFQQDPQVIFLICKISIILAM